jgi:hypothetical protein
MPDETTTTVVEETTEPADGTEHLGAAGKQALDRMKAERDDARREAKRVKELEAELDKVRNATATDAEKALNAAKAEGAAEATTRANERILRSEVRALATGKFADPGDALNFLDLAEFRVNENGDFDQKAVTKALDAVLADKPYLAAATGQRVPGVPVGARQGAPASEDMNAMIRRAAGRA